jgi:hypothetical protein
LFAFGLGLSLALAPMFSAQIAKADQVGDEEVIAVPAPREVTPEPVVVQAPPVTAPPPAFVELQRSSIGAGIGIGWGHGTLSFEQQLRVLGEESRLGDVGAAKIVAEERVRCKPSPTSRARTGGPSKGAYRRLGAHHDERAVCRSAWLRREGSACARRAGLQDRARLISQYQSKSR